MIRYAYNQQVDPPAPFLFVRLQSSESGQDFGDIPAQVDTGAGRTIVPWKVVESLQLRRIDESTFEGVSGIRVQLPLFSLVIQPRHLNPMEVIVAASRGEPYVLLGRDVLNSYRVFLYGPDLAFAIG